MIDDTVSEGLESLLLNVRVTNPEDLRPAAVDRASLRRSIVNDYVAPAGSTLLTPVLTEQPNRKRAVLVLSTTAVAAIPYIITHSYNRLMSFEKDLIAGTVSAATYPAFWQYSSIRVTVEHQSPMWLGIYNTSAAAAFLSVFEEYA
jgi:hypothetical protein